MSWKIRWEELDGDDVKGKEKKRKRARKVVDGYGQTEQSEALLNSRGSINSDKVGSLSPKVNSFISCCG